MRHPAHAFTCWPTIQWIFALHHHLWWEGTWCFPGACNSQEIIPRMTSRSGSLVPSTSELNKWIKVFSRIYKQLLEWWRQQGLLESILQGIPHCWKNSWRWFFSGMDTHGSGKRGKKGSGLHNHPLTSGFSLPQNHCLKIGCILCNFLTLQLIPGGS